jgi:hypothetical protein
MFNKELEKRIEEMENEIFGVEEKPEEQEGFFWLPSFYKKTTLKEKIENVIERVELIEDKFNLLLRYLNIEYHKITEENGIKTVKKLYKKIPKKKKG